MDNGYSNTVSNRPIKLNNRKEPSWAYGRMKHKFTFTR